MAQGKQKDNEKIQFVEQKQKIIFFKKDVGDFYTTHAEHETR